MAGELEFDAAGSNIDGSNPGTALAVLSNATYGTTAVSWPTPQPKVQWASSVDTEGSRPIPASHENRTISLSIDVKSAQGLRDLEAKLAKIHREGGTLRWTMPNSEVVNWDLLSVENFEPGFDVGYFINSGGFATVPITLTAAPYGRGAEITLTDHAETTNPFVIFTETGLKGDWPGLARLVIDNDEAGTSMRWGAWAIQSQYYSAASTAALFYEAEACALSSGTLAVGPTGASGAGSNTVFYGSLSTTATTLHYLGTSSSAQTHTGTFRVFARVYAPNTNAGTVSLGIGWTPYSQGITVTNDLVALSTTGSGALENQWAVVDLGLVSIPKARKGSQQWIGYVTAQSTSAGDDIYVDWIALMPADEGYGEAYASPSNALPLAGSSGGVSIEARWDGVLQQNVGGTAWLAPDVFEGRYLTIPPAMLESRTLRVIARFSRHIPLNVNRSLASVNADVVGDVSARLSYTPRYLVVASP